MRLRYTRVNICAVQHVFHLHAMHFTVGCLGLTSVGRVVDLRQIFASSTLTECEENGCKKTALLANRQSGRQASRSHDLGG